MGWVEDNKGQRPFAFTEQKNKFGYVNNPNWSKQANSVAFAEAHSLPVDASNKHVPCGHWHKGPLEGELISIGANYRWWQPSIDVLNGKIGFVSMHEDNNGSESKIIAVTYKDGLWKCLGIVNYAYVLSFDPKSCRLSSNDYMAYYYERWDELGDNYEMRLYIFREGQAPRHIDMWNGNWDTGIPYYVKYEAILDVMDCVGSRIACIADVIEVAGISYQRWVVKVSNDEGLTFPIEWEFPSYTEFYGCDAKLRMSLDGTIWIAYRESSAVPVTKIQLWKSNSSATNFTKVWEKDYYIDINSSTKYPNLTFDISDKDGKYITIKLRGLRVADITYEVIYSSSDYGVSFTAHKHGFADYKSFAQMTANGQYIVMGAEDYADSKYLFLRSADYGATFSEIDSGADGFGPYWINQQKHNNEIVFVQCAESYSPPAPSHNFQSVLYSNDNGATWDVIQSPVQNTVHEPEQFMIYNGLPTDEPQVWPFTK